MTTTLKSARKAKESMASRIVNVPKLKPVEPADAGGSPYETMFGMQAPAGRPIGAGLGFGVRSRDPAITEQARRRAKRVLMERHRDEFENLFAVEIAHIERTGMENL